MNVCWKICGCRVFLPVRRYLVVRVGDEWAISHHSLTERRLCLFLPWSFEFDLKSQAPFIDCSFVTHEFILGISWKQRCTFIQSNIMQLPSRMEISQRSVSQGSNSVNKKGSPWNSPKRMNKAVWLLVQSQKPRFSAHKKISFKKSELCISLPFWYRAVTLMSIASLCLAGVAGFQRNCG